MLTKEEIEKFVTWQHSDERHCFDPLDVIVAILDGESPKGGE